MKVLSGFEQVILQTERDELYAELEALIKVLESSDLNHRKAEIACNHAKKIMLKYHNKGR